MLAEVIEKCHISQDEVEKLANLPYSSTSMPSISLIGSFSALSALGGKREETLENDTSLVDSSSRI